MIFDPSAHSIYHNAGSTNSFLYTALSGVTNLCISTSLSIENPYLLGGQVSPSEINAPKQVEMNLQYDLIQKDNIFSLTGSNPVSFYIYLAPSCYIYIYNLFLNNYSINLTVGNLPKISAKFTSYSDTLIPSMSAAPNVIDNPYSINIPKLNSLSISGVNAFDSAYYLLNNLDVAAHPYFSTRPYEHYISYGKNEGRMAAAPISITNSENSIITGNIIYSMDYSISMNRCIYYNFNDYSANCVFLNMPLCINVSLNSKYDNNQFLDNYLLPKENQSFLNFYILNSGTYTSCFPVLNAKLLNTQVQLSSENTMEVKRDIVGYYGI